MKHTLFILALCILAILIGAVLFFHNPKDLTGKQAAGDEVAQVAAVAVVPVPVAFTELESNVYAQEAPDERKNIAARDADSFARLWKMAHGMQKIAVPTIDFSKEYVIGVFAGTKSSGGYDIAVSDVSDLGDTRTVAVTLTTPGANCVVTEAITSPYQLIRVPVSTNYLKAVDTSVTNECK